MSDFRDFDRPVAEDSPRRAPGFIPELCLRNLDVGSWIICPASARWLFAILVWLAGVSSTIFVASVSDSASTQEITDAELCWWRQTLDADMGANTQVFMKDDDMRVILSTPKLGYAGADTLQQKQARLMQAVNVTGCLGHFNAVQLNYWERNRTEHFFSGLFARNKKNVYCREDCLKCLEGANGRQHLTFSEYADCVETLPKCTSRRLENSTADYGSAARALRSEDYSLDLAQQLLSECPTLFWAAEGGRARLLWRVLGLPVGVQLASLILKLEGLERTSLEPLGRSQLLLTALTNYGKAEDIEAREWMVDSNTCRGWDQAIGRLESDRDGDANMQIVEVALQHAGTRPWWPDDHWRVVWVDGAWRSSSLEGVIMRQWGRDNKQNKWSIQNVQGHCLT